MKKYVSLIVLFLCIVAVSSCKKDDAKVDEVWKAKNDVEFAKKATEGYLKLEAPSGGYIYYKVLTPAKEGETEYPNFTDKVKANYIGWLVDNNKTRFDSSEGFDMEDPAFHVPSTFAVNQVITGWTIALQEMKRGEKWEVFIPWPLAYGSSGSKQGAVPIPGYSTLHFIIELVDMQNIGQ